MSQIDEQIEQCEKDIAILQENLAKLKTEKMKKSEFEPGDIAKNCNGCARLIVKGSDKKVFSVDICGVFQSFEQDFKYHYYRKIGRISDFIKDEK